jgi:hypothetical protein
MVAALALLNASDRNYDEAMVLWGAATVVFGFVARDFRFALLSFLAIPISVAFGYPEEYLGGEPAPLWWSGVVYGFLFAMLIALEVGIRLAVDEWRTGRRGATGTRD